MKTVTINNVTIGQGLPLVFIAGPCVIESYESCMRLAEKLKALFLAKGAPFIFKA